MAMETEAKWEGKAIAMVKGSTPNEVWPALEDFCNVHKLLPSVDVCYQLDGVYGQPGLVRYCGSAVSSLGDETSKWCHEKLIQMDPIGRSLTYEVLENNMGIKSYSGSMKVLAIDDGDEPGCLIEWSFVADPIDGLTSEGFLAYVEASVQAMAENIGKALRSTCQS
ncbi:hypothetical protein NMG60_11000820 [Bertholletia excelsa]